MIGDCYTVAWATVARHDDWPTIDIGEAAVVHALPLCRVRGSVIFLDCKDRNAVLVLTGGANGLLTRGTPYDGPLISRALGFEHTSAAHVRMEACGWAPNRVLFRGMKQPARSVLNFLVEHASINAPPSQVKLPNIRNTFVGLYNKWAVGCGIDKVCANNATNIFRILGRVHKACVANEFGFGKSPWRQVLGFSNDPLRFVTLEGGDFLHNDSLPKDGELYSYIAGHKLVPFLLCGAEVQLFTSIGDPLLTEARAEARSRAVGSPDGQGQPLN